MSDFDHSDAVRAVAHAGAAGLLGVLGAVARLAADPSDKPMLRPAVFIRIAGDASLGIGLWLLISALGYTSVWAMAAAWIGGALGYATIHDLLLRALNRKINGGP